MDVLAKKKKTWVTSLSPGNFSPGGNALNNYPLVLSNSLSPVESRYHALSANDPSLPGVLLSGIGFKRYPLLSRTFARKAYSMLARKA